MDYYATNKFSYNYNSLNHSNFYPHQKKTGWFGHRPPGTSNIKVPSGSGRSRYVTTNDSGERVLTSKGEQRYTSAKKNNARKSKDKRVSEDALLDPDNWVKNDIGKMTDIAKSAKDANSASKRLSDMVFKKKQNERLDLSKMTDKEIQDIINRENLEVRYNDMFNKSEESKGKKFLNTYFELNSIAADTAIAGLTIATLIIALAKGLD